MQLPHKFSTVASGKPNRFFHDAAIISVRDILKKVLLEFEMCVCVCVYFYLFIYWMSVRDVLKKVLLECEMCFFLQDVKAMIACSNNQSTLLLLLEQSFILLEKTFALFSIHDYRLLKSDTRHVKTGLAHPRACLPLFDVDVDESIIFQPKFHC